MKIRLYVMIFGKVSLFSTIMILLSFMFKIRNCIW